MKRALDGSWSGGATLSRMTLFSSATISKGNNVPGEVSCQFSVKVRSSRCRSP